MAVSVASAQGVKISSMPELTDPASIEQAYFPVVYNLINYKVLGANLSGGGGGTMRFGYLTEDDAAGENRTFNLGGSYQFEMKTNETGELFHFKQGEFQVLVVDATDGGKQAQVYAYGLSSSQSAGVGAFYGDGHESSVEAYSDATQSIATITLGTNPHFRIEGLGTGTTANVLYYDDATGDVYWGAGGGGGGSESTTASNALTEVGDDIQMGGDFTANTTIGNAAQNFGLTITRLGTGASVTLTTVSSTGTAITATTTSGNAFFATSTSGKAALFTINPSSTNTEVELMTMRRTTSGTAAAGLGGYFNHTLEASDGTEKDAAHTSWRWLSATAGSQQAAYDISVALGANASLSGVPQFSVLGTGNVTINTAGKAIGLTAPNGTIYYGTISNAGVLSWSTTAP